ncbi:MAG: hypothetical protein KGO50_17250 [Myxococcales bacterium]|jgi:hypothetical protein|nr:hypothetical protein [Myxococcales bacterium]
MASPNTQLPAHGHQADVQASYRQGRLAGMVMGASAMIVLMIVWTYMWWLVVAGGVGVASWIGFRAWSKSKKSSAERAGR